MKLKLFTEQILTVLLVVVVLPWMLTMLLHSKMNQIYEKIQSETRYISVKSGEETEEISLEEYVLEVTAAELPADAQEEAVKAQMVLIRTNAYRQLMEGKIREKERKSLTELELQGAGKKFRKAQKETKGQILTCQDKPIMASYHKISAGQTREGQEVFHSEDYEYLKSKACPGDKNAPDYKQTIQIDDSWRAMEIEEKDSAGYVLRLKLGETEMSGEEFRIQLGLPSSNFRIEKNGDGVFVTTYGVGHGLGMSQYTAQKLAENGTQYQEILAYFFDKTKLENLSEL